MEFPVYWKNVQVGTAVTKEDGYAVVFDIKCAVYTTEILRCFGVQDPQNIVKIGVLEPSEGQLLLNRKLSKQSLGIIPTQYYLGKDETEIEELLVPQNIAIHLPDIQPLSDIQEPVSISQADNICTGDALLDAAVRKGDVRAERTEDGCQFICVFDKKQPFALDFAAVQCVIEKIDEEYFAILKI